MNNDVRQVIIVSSSTKMPKGKLAAQVAHASLNSFLSSTEVIIGDEYEFKLGADALEWMTNGSHTKVCVKCDSEDEMLDIYNRLVTDGIPCAKIIDSGRTVFNGVPTLTAIGVGPAPKATIDQYTSHLKLL